MFWWSKIFQNILWRVTKNNFVRTSKWDCISVLTLDKRQSKILSTNVAKKSLETEFFIAICRLTGNNCQSKALFLVIFYQRSHIVESFFDCHLFGVVLGYYFNLNKQGHSDEMLHSVASYLGEQCLSKSKKVKIAEIGSFGNLWFSRSGNALYNNQ